MPKPKMSVPEMLTVMEFREYVEEVRLGEAEYTPNELINMAHGMANLYRDEIEKLLQVERDQRDSR